MSPGQQMYERYAALLLEHHDCGMDTWERLAAEYPR